MDLKDKILVVIVGPTAVGKTSLSIKIAKKLNTEIISADSKQFFKEITIGTAKPSIEELNTIKHHLIDFLDLKENYNAGDFIKDSTIILKELFSKNKYVIMTGGSGLYINSLCNGLDDIPPIDPKIRQNLNNEFLKKGLSDLKKELKIRDPEYYNEVDKDNPRRIIRALEVCRTTNKPYSSYRNNKKKNNEYEIIKIGLNRDRKELYDKINLRVEQMIDLGLIEEAKKVYKYRNLNSLQTVGYKEIFEYLDKKITLEKAIELIKRNTRRYAKRQMTWFSKDEEIKWFHPNEIDKILKYVLNIN